MYYFILIILLASVGEICSMDQEYVNQHLPLYSSRETLKTCITCCKTLEEILADRQEIFTSSLTVQERTAACLSRQLRCKQFSETTKPQALAFLISLVDSIARTSFKSNTKEAEKYLILRYDFQPLPKPSSERNNSPFLNAPPT